MPRGQVAPDEPNLELGRARVDCRSHQPTTIVLPQRAMKEDLECANQGQSMAIKGNQGRSHLPQRAMKEDLETAVAHPRSANGAIEEQRQLLWGAVVGTRAPCAVASLPQSCANGCGEEGGSGEGSTVHARG